MKKIQRGIAIALFLAAGQVYAQNDSFTLKGKVTGSIASFKKAYFNFKDGKTNISDSVEIDNNGLFSYSCPLHDNEIERVAIALGNTQRKRRFADMLTLYIRKGEQVTINADGLLQNAVITGISKEGMDYQEFNNRFFGVKRTNEERVTLLKDLIMAYPDSKFSFNVFSSFFSPSFGDISQQLAAQLPEMFTLYDHFSPGIKNSPEALAYARQINDFRGLMVGGVLPDFTAKNTEGKAVKLSDLRGKYVLVDFWASWCAPCRAEFPHLKEAYAKFKSKNFEILGYSLDNEASVWISAIENDDLHWLNVSNLQGRIDDTVIKRYHISGIPSNFLIDPEGKVLATNLREDQVEPILLKFIK